MLPLSNYYLHKWLEAFLLTQAIEMPIYIWFLSRHLGHSWRIWVLAFGASAITHPIVWFVFPWRLWNHNTTYAAAETFAVLTEAIYLAIIGIPAKRALLLALLANATSVAASEVLRRFFDF